MRVLPFVSLTVPRVALLKSYSVLISSFLPSRDATGRNQADNFTMYRVHNHQRHTVVCHTDGDESGLAFRVGIFAMQRQRILKDAFRIGERNAVLPQVQR